jgi:hypothetical protein
MDFFIGTGKGRLCRGKIACTSIAPLVIRF